MFVGYLHTYVHTAAWSTGAIRGLTEPHLQKWFPVEQYVVTECIPNEKHELKRHVKRKAILHHLARVRAIFATAAGCKGKIRLRTCRIM
jgi:hypothetical protein